ncbi:hypothetical protein FB451DRAFT_1180799 [Mycena latifolia]|nr:hypothetical protein FB451DRAFT_1180799 [Mycena latifolia]
MTSKSQASSLAENGVPAIAITATSDNPEQLLKMQTMKKRHSLHPRGSQGRQCLSWRHAIAGFKPSLRQSNGLDWMKSGQNPVARTRYITQVCETRWSGIVKVPSKEGSNVLENARKYPYQASSAWGEPDGQFLSSDFDFSDILLEYMVTKGCRRIPWNKFFGNDFKYAGPYPVPPNSRCCDNCSPELFPVETVSITGGSTLRSSRRRYKKASDEVVQAITRMLEVLRENIVRRQ